MINFKILEFVSIEVNLYIKEEQKYILKIFCNIYPNYPQPGKKGYHFPPFYYVRDVKKE